MVLAIDSKWKKTNRGIARMLIDFNKEQTIWRQQNQAIKIWDFFFLNNCNDNIIAVQIC
jgi:hypothetical protein